LKLSAYANYDAVGLATAIAHGDYSPAEVIGAAIDAIESLNPRLNAVVMKNYANARAMSYAGCANRPLGGAGGGLRSLFLCL
jgi:amidase